MREPSVNEEDKCGGFSASLFTLNMGVKLGVTNLRSSESAAEVNGTAPSATEVGEPLNKKLLPRCNPSFCGFLGCEVKFYLHRNPRAHRTPQFLRHFALLPVFSQL